MMGSTLNASPELLPPRKDQPYPFVMTAIIQSAATEISVEC